MRVLKSLAALLLIAYLPAQATEVDALVRQDVVAAIVHHLQSDYIDPAVGGRAAKALRAQQKSGAFNGSESGVAFAAALAKSLRESTGDGHLNVEYVEQPLQDGEMPAEVAFTTQEMERYYGAGVNFGVKKLERLENNIGLLELSVFPPATMGGTVVSAAMQVLAHTDALIIDLRHNGGGSDTVTLVASYLFDTQQPMSGIYDRPSNTTRQRYTQAYVPGARFGPHKPVYVLTSKRTFSAAEALAYDLQALKRATIIGEPSGGGAHPFKYRRIHPHFVLWSVTERSVNPITHANWQGVGVQPDVRVPADQALAKAIELIGAAEQSERLAR
jgi:C-terminal processing protease CtpA/Prc